MTTKIDWEKGRFIEKDTGIIHAQDSAIYWTKCGLEPEYPSWEIGSDDTSVSCLDCLDTALCEQRFAETTGVSQC